MSLQPFRFPDDASALLEVTGAAFQFAENPTWSVPQDLGAVVVETVTALRRIWPLVRLGGLVYPPLRQVLGGFIYWQAGQPVGAANMVRLKRSRQFEIGNVGVRPEFRRRGIGRALMEACLAQAQRWHGDRVWLNVISENGGAVRLYESLGFVHVDTSYELSITYPDLAAPDPLPAGYHLRADAFGEWRARWELAARLAHPALCRLAPPRPADFQTPPPLRWLAGRFFRLAGIQFLGWTVHTSSGHPVAALDVFLQPDTTTARLVLDPAHAYLAAPLIQRLCCLDVAPPPAPYLTLSVAAPDCAAVAMQLGFALDFTYQRMYRPLVWSN